MYELNKRLLALEQDVSYWNPKEDQELQVAKELDKEL